MFSPREANLERGWPGRIEGDRVIQLAAQTLQSFFTGGGSAREHAEFRLEDIVLRPPVLHPPSVRIFEPGAEPLFSFSNPASIYGPEDEIPYPEATQKLDFGAGIAAVIGAEGSIGGFTVMNAWAAPDLEPPKDRDFATSIGPIVVTPDEWTVGHDIRVHVNGELQWVGRVGDVRPMWDALAEHAALNTRLVAGDVLGSSGQGSDGGWLRPGDVVEVEVGGIGVLRNRVRPAASSA